MIRSCRPLLPLAAFPVLLLSGCTSGHGGGATPVAGTPGFSLGLSAANLSVPAGGGAFETVTVTPLNGFTGAITLTLDQAPPGVTGSGSIAAGAGQGTLALLVDPSVPPQTLNGLEVRGVSGGLNVEAPLLLTVAPPLPAGLIGPAQVQASAGRQQGGGFGNFALALQPVGGALATDLSGSLVDDPGFDPDGSFD